MNLVKLEKVSKKYRNTFALKDIDLTIKKGEFIALVGDNGSGKSTLLSIIAGLNNVSSGEVYVNNENITKLSNDQKTIFRRKNVGYIYQFYNLIPVLSVRENIILPIVLDERKVNHEKLYSIISELKLEKYLNYLPNELSGGLQQKVAIARALISNPVIVLADEPTGNLDPKTALKIVKKLKYYNEEYGQTIVMVTHDTKMMRLAKRVVELKDGKIVKDSIDEKK